MSADVRSTDLQVHRIELRAVFYVLAKDDHAALDIVGARWPLGDIGIELPANAEAQYEATAIRNQEPYMRELCVNVDE